MHTLRVSVYHCAGSAGHEHTSSTAAGTDGIVTVLIVQQMAVKHLVPTISVTPVCQQMSVRCFEEVVSSN